MRYDFTTERHTLTAYQTASAAFVDEIGCTPMDVLRAPSSAFPFTTRMRAQYLDAWDLWLFSQTEEDAWLLQKDAHG